MPTFGRTLLFLGFLLAVSGAAVAAPPPKIVEISGTVQGNEARVRFTLQNAFTPEMVEALKSGIEISFRITVEVERVYRAWFNQTVGEVRNTISIRYDVLSKVYRLHRSGGDELLPDVHAALDRMTRFEIAVPVTGTVDRGKPYRARVRARLDKAGLSDSLRAIVFFASLWDVETDWARGFLHAP